MANSVDPDQMPHSAASDLDLQCLLQPVCPNIKGYYGMFIMVCAEDSICNSTGEQKNIPMATI